MFKLLVLLYTAQIHICEMRGHIDLINTEKEKEKKAV